MNLKKLLLCRLLRRHQWKRLPPSIEFSAIYECKRCKMVWVPGVGVIEKGEWW